MSAKRMSSLAAVFASLCIITPSSVAIEITAWSNSKTGDGDLIFKVDPGEPISFSVSTEQPPGEYLWYVNQEQQAATGSSFSWTMPTDRGTWNVMAEVREPNLLAVGVDLSQYAFKVWTVTTTEVRFVEAGEDIQAAIDALSAEGGVVELAGGTWTGVAAAVTSRKNITLRGQGRNGTMTTTLDAESGLGIVVSLSSNVSVQDLRVLGGGYSGIMYVSSDLGLIHDAYISGASDTSIVLMGHANQPVHHVAVINCEVADGGNHNINIGVDIDAYEIRVRNCDVHDAGIVLIKVDATRAHLYDSHNYIENNVLYSRCNSAIYIYSGSFNTIARNNHVYGTRWNGIHVHMNSNSVVENNLIHDTGLSGILVTSQDYTDNTTVRNNIVYQAGANGIEVSIYKGSDPTNTFLYDNTVYASAQHGIRLGAGLTSVFVRNNILANNLGYGINAESVPLACAYNAASDNQAGDYLGVTPGEGSISGDPQFADPARADFHLRSQAGRWNGSGWVTDLETSPAVDAGDPADDFANEFEPNGGRINMGAYGNTKEASKSAAGPDFSLSCEPSALTADKSASATTRCTVRSLVGFNGDVALSCAGAPLGVSCVFNPASLTLAADGSATSELLVEVAASVEGGGYRFEVAGAATSATRRFGIQLTVRGDEADGGDPGGDDGGREDGGDGDPDGRDGSIVTGGCGCGGVDGLGAWVVVSAAFAQLARGVGSRRKRVAGVPEVNVGVDTAVVPEDLG